MSLERKALPSCLRVSELTRTARQLAREKARGHWGESSALYLRPEVGREIQFFDEKVSGERHNDVSSACPGAVWFDDGGCFRGSWKWDE